MAALGLSPPVSAEDSDRLRGYVAMRYDMASLTRAHDEIGGAIGANFNRFLGAELALDSYDLKVGSLSELSVMPIVLQGRLRYPLLESRLVPYVIGGVGVAVSQGNDARAPVTWDNGKTEVHPAGSLGAGVEYFIADNIALGVEGKYLFSDEVGYASGERQGTTQLSAPLLGVGVRLFYPENDPIAVRESARSAAVRFYLDLRLGGALPVTNKPFSGFVISPEQAVFGSNLALDVGVTLGAAIGRYAAVEVTMDNYEYTLAIRGDGNVGEYAVFPVLVQGRLRYPLLDDRLEPYLLAGVGGEVGQVNDLNEKGKALGLKGNDLAPVGVCGLGAEYYVLGNVAVGGVAKYLISRGHEIRLPGEAPLTGNFDTVVLAFSIRIVFADL